MLLHPHRPTLVFVTPPVALLVFLATVVDASAAGALLRRLGLANCAFPTHFARKTLSANSTAKGRRVLNKAAVFEWSRDIGAWSARMALYFGRVPLCVGGLFLQASEVSSCASIKAIGIATHISRRRPLFMRAAGTPSLVRRVVYRRSRE
jgi:hypothetical protein